MLENKKAYVKGSPSNMKLLMYTYVSTRGTLNLWDPMQEFSKKTKLYREEAEDF